MSKESSVTLADSLSKFTSHHSQHHAITTEKLNGKNYNSWSASIQIWFIGQDQEEHLEKGIDQVVDVDRPAWKKIDAQLLVLLWQAIDSSLMPIFRAFLTCHSTWTQAKNLYMGDITRASDVIENLFQLK